MDGQKVNPASEEDEWEYRSPGRQKAEEIASEKIFGYQPFTADQVEKQRNALGYILNQLQANITGSAGSLLDTLGARKGVAKGAEQLFPGLGSVVESLPTVQQRIESGHENLVPKEYEPSGLTKRIGEGAGILGSFMGLPIPGTNLARAGAASIAAPAIGAGAEKLGAPDWAQTGLENLALIGMSLKGGKSLEETGNLLHKQAKRLLPQNATANTANINNWATALRNQLARRGHDTETAPVIAKLDDIIHGTQTGQSLVDQIKAWRTSVNSLIKDPSTLKGAKKFFLGINRQLNRVIDNYGRTNPKWLNAQRRADTFHAGIENSRKATNFLRNKINPNNPLTWLVFGLKKTAAGTGLTKLAEVSHRIATNPEMRKYYAEALKHAFKREARGANYYINKLDKKIDKEFPQRDEDEEYTYQYK